MTPWPCSRRVRRPNPVSDLSPVVHADIASATPLTAERPPFPKPSPSDGNIMAKGRRKNVLRDFENNYVDRSKTEDGDPAGTAAFWCCARYRADAPQQWSYHRPPPMVNGLPVDAYFTAGTRHHRHHGHNRRGRGDSISLRINNSLGNWSRIYAGHCPLPSQGQIIIQSV